MKKVTVAMASMAALLALCAERTVAQEPVEQNVVVEQTEEKKEGFLRRAFRDMRESARLQHKIDKANFEATKLESKAFYEEQKRLSNPKVRTSAERERMERDLEAANQRKAEAQAKLDSIKGL